MLNNGTEIKSDEFTNTGQISNGGINNTQVTLIIQNFTKNTINLDEAIESLDTLNLAEEEKVKLKEILSKVGENNIVQIKKEESPKSLKENIQLRDKTKNDAKKYLDSSLKQFKLNPSFFLGRNQLFYIYSFREEMEFSEEELIFLVKSSLKNQFPNWYWSFYYRGKFGNIVPLLKSAYKDADINVKIKAIEFLNQFSNTQKDVSKLVVKERNPFVLGKAIDILAVKHPQLAENILYKAISEKNIPLLNESEKIKLKLGDRERRFIYSQIVQDNFNVKKRALKILSLSSDTVDLTFLKSLLKDDKNHQFFPDILKCISKIGSFDDVSIIEKCIDSQWEKLFLESVDTVAFLKVSSLWRKLFHILQNPNSLYAGRFGQFDRYKAESKIRNALSLICNEEIYQAIVAKILSFPVDKYESLYTWEYFNILEDIRNIEVIELMKKEKRLLAYSRWKDTLGKIKLDEAVEKKDLDEILKLVSIDGYLISMLALREVWKLILPVDAFKYRNIIENLRADLISRLEEVEKSDASKESKELATKGLDYFLGENQSFFNNFEDRRSFPEDGESDGNAKFRKLREDIGKFERIEDEYIGFALSEKNLESMRYLIELLGRPYSVIYSNVAEAYPPKKIISKSLINIIEKEANLFIRFDALDAAIVSKVISKTKAREVALEIYEEGKSIPSVDKVFSDTIMDSSLVSTLIRIGKISDLSIIEKIRGNKDATIFNGYRYYQSFYHLSAFKKILQFLDLANDDETAKEAISALDNLDYFWTKKVLKIKEI